MFGDVTCGRYVLLTPHVTLFFCLCGVTAIWCIFLVCWLQFNISRGEANFFKIYFQTRCWIEEISLVAGEGKWVFRNKQVGFSFFRKLKFQLASILLLLSECPWSLSHLIINCPQFYLLCFSRWLFPTKHNIFLFDYESTTGYWYWYICLMIEIKQKNTRLANLSKLLF